jgi:ankyrin repeat protein
LKYNESGAAMEKDWQRAIASSDVAWVRSIINHVARAEHAAVAGQDDANSGPSPAPPASLHTLINSKDQHGQTGLMVAAMRGRTEVVRVLVENQAELNHTAKYHLTALMLAVINRHPDIVRILVAAGADREICGAGAPGFADLTALALAERAGYDEIVKILQQSSS